jgi:hypothetical protein
VLAIEYLDARGADGCARKYRVMMVGGELYPLHLAISQDWKIHYFSADMAERAEHRAEEAIFLADMPAALGGKGNGCAPADAGGARPRLWRRRLRSQSAWRDSAL